MVARPIDPVPRRRRDSTADYCKQRLAVRHVFFGSAVATRRATEYRAGNSRLDGEIAPPLAVLTFAR